MGGHRRSADNNYWGDDCLVCWLIVRWLVAQPVRLLVGQLVIFCSLLEWCRLASQLVIDVPTISK